METATGKPADPKWVRTASGRFFRLAKLDPESEGLTDKGGVYVVWHGGMRPRWLVVGHSNNLARTFHDLGEESELLAYEVNGGIWLTWSPILGEFRAGVVAYLAASLKPLLSLGGTPDRNAKPIAVMAPGGQQAQKAPG